MRCVLCFALGVALLPGCYGIHSLGESPVGSDDVGSAPTTDAPSGPSPDPSSDTDSTSDPDASDPDASDPDSRLADVSCQFVEIAGGFNRGVAALHSDGSVWGWGWDEPVRPIEGLVDIVQVSAHDKNVCGVHSSGEVSCGLLFDDYGGTYLHLGRVPGLTDVVQVAVGEMHACAVLHDGRVACWGYNYEGVLGIPTDWEVYPEPVLVLGIDDVTSIDASREQTCAIHEDGRVSCWGLDADFFEPPAGLRASQVVVGERHACAIRIEGGVICWGIGYDGQLGDDSVATLDALRLSAGTSHTCAHLASGEVVCWGSDSQGELGTGASPMERAPEATPQTLPRGDRALSVVAGHHGTCTLEPDCEVRCYGWAPARTLPSTEK